MAEGDGFDPFREGKPGEDDTRSDVWRDYVSGFEASSTWMDFSRWKANTCVIGCFILTLTSLILSAFITGVIMCCFTHP